MNQTKRLVVLCAMAMLLAGCDGAGATMTPGNVAVAGQEAVDESPDAQQADQKSSDDVLEAAPTVTPEATQVAAPPPASADAKDGYIGLDRAKELALAAAGMTADQVTFTKSKLDQDDGKVQYDIEFVTTDGKEYDYELNARTGHIESMDYDDKHIKPNTSADISIDQSSLISLEQATAIVLERVPGAEARHLKIKLDYDDGRARYEGEIKYNGTEYEFELDAASGAVLEWEAENDD